MSFHDIENPTGGMPMERVIDQPTLEQHLLERILSSANMEQTWKRVRANKGAPGVDGITIEQFPDHLYPLRAGQDGKRGQKSAGFLTKIYFKTWS